MLTAPASLGMGGGCGEREAMSAPLSVLHFSSAAVRGGAEEHVLTLLRGFDRTMFTPALACPAAVAEQLRDDVPSGVEVIGLDVDRRAPGSGLAALARLLSRRRVAILHCHQFRSSLLAAPVALVCRVPVVIETPHIREHWRVSWLKSRFVVDRLVGRLVDYFIAVSESNGRYLVEDKGLPARKVVVIQNGCDVDKYRWDPARAAELRAQLGLDDADPVLITIGRLEPQKGHGVLLDAMPALLRAFPRLRLVCLGEGALRAPLEQQASRLGLGNAVRFVGFQSDVGSWLGIADVMVLASFYEGLPLVAMEALAARRVVVATAVDGTPEVVRDGVTGLTVAPGDPAALAGAIGRLLGDRELRDRLAGQGQEWVRARFTHRRQIQETQDLYRRAWRERSGASQALAWRTR